MCRRLNIFPVLLAAVLVLSSCGKSYRDVRLTSVSLVSVAPSGFRSVSAVLHVGVDNPAPAFFIENFEAEVFCEGLPVIVFTSPGLSVEGKTAKSYDLSLSGTVNEKYSILSLMAMLASRDLSPYTVDIRAGIALKEKGPRKKIHLKNVPVERLLSGKLL